MLSSAPAMAQLTPTPFGPSYVDCTEDELRGFVRARGLTLSRDDLVNVLINGDRGRTFRRMDLIPELRNAIYRELLTLREDSHDGHRFCWPQILATSRQIYDEAQDILYCDNVFELAICTHFCVNGCHVRFMIDEEEFSTDGYGESYIDWDGEEEPFIWPPHLLRARHLRLQVHFAAEVPTLHDNEAGRYWIAKGNEGLYALSCFLRSHNHLQSLSIEWISGDNVRLTTETVVDYLWLICRLFTPTKISIAGLSDETCIAIQASAQSLILPNEGNIVATYQKYSEEACWYSVAGTDTDELALFPEDRAAVANAYKAAEEFVSRNEVISAEKHAQFVRLTKTMKNAVVGVDFPPLTQRVKQSSHALWMYQRIQQKRQDYSDCEDDEDEGNGEL